MGCSSIWSHYTGPIDRGRGEAALGELPLCGAARIREKGARPLLRGAPTVRGCSVEGGRKLLWEGAFLGAPATEGCSIE